MREERPNILVFCVDEMRADHMACAGNGMVRTPNLDRIAQSGTLFTRSYCNNPICMPARASMFTGLMPRDHGLRVNGQSLRRDLPTLPGALRQAGYRTHAAGKLHLTPWVPRCAQPDPARYPECRDNWLEGRLAEFPTPYYGFQSVDFVGGHTSYAYGPYLEWLRKQGGSARDLTAEAAIETPSGAPTCYKMGIPEERHYNRFIADSTIRVIQETAQPGAKPFFAWCSFPDPHAPIAPPRPYCDLYDPAEVAPPPKREGELADLPPFYARILAGDLHPNGSCNTGISDAHWREMIALTYGMISHLDAEVGRVLDALDSTGQTDNTIIVFVSDHGDMMGDHGLIWKAFYTFQGCTRIPFIVAAPGMARGRVCDSLVCQVDLMPSLLDLAGVAEPGGDWTASETPYERGALRPLSLRPGRSWRGLLDGTTDATRSNVVIENDDPTTGYQVRALVTPRYRLAVYPGSEYGELYDLDTDPYELHNLWDQPERRDTRNRLTAELLDAYALSTPAYPVPPWNS